MVRTVLFVCTGNTCRSPLAEGLFREMAQREGLAVTIKSAGVSAMNGASISAHSQTVLREKGAKPCGSSRILDRKLAAEADLILTMTASHKRQVLSRFPDAAGRVYTLKEYVEEPQAQRERENGDKEAAEKVAEQAVRGFPSSFELNRSLLFDFLPADHDIADPFGGSLEEYRFVGDEIEECLQKLVHKLKNQ